MKQAVFYGHFQYNHSPPVLCMRNGDIFMPKKSNLIGQRFGMLVVTEKSEETQDRYALWKCRCDCGGEILLVGVGHERNTYIHSVEEVLNVPNRLAAEPMLLITILPDGREKKVYMRKHYNPDQPHISEDFVKLNQAFLDCGAVEEVMFGDAKCLLCDAQKVFRVVRHVLAPDPECLVTKPEIPTERWMNFE